MADKRVRWAARKRNCLAASPHTHAPFPSRLRAPLRPAQLPQRAHGLCALPRPGRDAAKH
eukprot:2563631-Pleurochrysis_carterae.AAC.4